MYFLYKETLRINGFYRYLEKSFPDNTHFEYDSIEFSNLELRNVFCQNCEFLAKKTSLLGRLSTPEILICISGTLLFLYDHPLIQHSSNIEFFAGVSSIFLDCSFGGLPVVSSFLTQGSQAPKKRKMREMHAEDNPSCKGKNNTRVRASNKLD